MAGLPWLRRGEFARISICGVSLARQLCVDRDLSHMMPVVRSQNSAPHLRNRVEVKWYAMGPFAGEDEQLPQQREYVDLGVDHPADLHLGFAYSCSARLNRIQLVAMYLSSPFGILPRWVWVNAVGAISSEPVFGAIRRFW